MAGESDMMEYGLMAFEASDFGGTVRYGATDGIPCSPGTIGVGGRFVAGGISPNAEMTVVIRKSAYSGTPFKVGKPITITTGNGDVKALKIADEGIRDCIFAWELTCDAASQNA